MFATEIIRLHEDLVANMFANMSITNFFLTITAIGRLLLLFPMRSHADSISSSYHPEAN